MAQLYSISASMKLQIPFVGVQIGPDWATNIDASLTIIDSHNHSPGSGVQITPTGLNINAALPFNGNSASAVGGMQMSTLTGDPSTTTTLYTKSVNLFWKDGNGTVIQITSGGGVAGSPGNISGLPSTPTGGAGIAWQNSQGTFQFTDDSSAPGGNADIGSLVLRYPGSYPAPSGNAIIVQAPTTLATQFSLTLPAALPAANGAWLTSDPVGNISYTNVDGTTLQISSGVASVRIAGLTGIVGTQLSASANILGSQLSATAGIVGTQLAAGTLTGTEMASNINLPGSAVQADSRNVVVSNTNATNGLGVVRGTVPGAGSGSGEGWTSTLVSTGIYSVNFTTGFADTCIAVVSISQSAIAAYAIVAGTNSSSITVHTSLIAGGLVDVAWSFIAMGQVIT